MANEPTPWLIFQFEQVNARLDAVVQAQAAGFSTLSKQFTDHSHDDAAVERRVQQIEIDFRDRRDVKQGRDKLLLALIGAPWLIEAVHLLVQFSGRP